MGVGWGMSPRLIALSSRVLSQHSHSASHLVSSPDFACESRHWQTAVVAIPDTQGSQEAFPLTACRSIGSCCRAYLRERRGLEVCSEYCLFPLTALARVWVVVFAAGWLYRAAELVVMLVL
jgi:hypothetical protein